MTDTLSILERELVKRNRLADELAELRRNNADQTTIAELKKKLRQSTVNVSNLVGLVNWKEVEREIDRT